MIPSPEQQLWCAVVQRALDDARDEIGTPSAAAERRRARDEARNWFLSNDVDFRRACEAAGFDPDRVRDHALKLFATS
jgi:hypothetical protein